MASGCHVVTAWEPDAVCLHVAAAVVVGLHVVAMAVAEAVGLRDAAATVAVAVAPAVAVAEGLRYAAASTRSSGSGTEHTRLPQLIGLTG